MNRSSLFLFSFLTFTLAMLNFLLSVRLLRSDYFLHDRAGIRAVLSVFDLGELYSEGLGFGLTR